ncbi:MAG: 6-pyruvoyl-tetrahydropterin synthase-related protein [Patescibacteria group bacterium]
MKKINKINLFAILLIVLISLPPIQTLIKPGMFEAHDGRLHIIRLHWFDQELKSGQFPVRWSETANHLYGYPIFNFYYPGLYYSSELFHLMGLTLVDSMKLVLGLAFIGSGVAMYLFLRLWVGRFSAITGSILYIYAPFRFVSMFVTGRWAESLVFLTLPVAFLAAAKAGISGRKRHLLFGSLAYGLLILTHNVTSLLFTPILFLWTYLSKKQASLKEIALMFIGGLAVSAYFWLPAVYETRWTHQGQQPVYDVVNNFPPLKSYLYQAWGYGFSLNGTKDGVSPMIGFAQIAALLLSAIFVLFNKKFYSPAKILTIISFIAFFLMLKASIPIWNGFPIMKTVQFPNRLTAILVFGAAVAGSFAIETLPKLKIGWIKWIAGSGLIILAIYGNRNHFRPGVFDRYYDNDITGFYQLLFGVGNPSNEVTPIWSENLPPEYVDKAQVLLPKDNLSSPNIKIEELSLKNRNYKFAVNNKTKQTYGIRINTIYYPGWKIYVDNSIYSLNLPIKQSPDNKFGLINVNIPPGEHTLQIHWSETLLRNTADAVSIFALIFILLSLKQKQNNK